MAAAGGGESSGRPDDDDVRDEESMRSEMLREKDPSAPMPVTACVVKGVGDAMAGAVMGSVFGFGTGLFQKRGFKGALDSGLSSAKNFALLSGIHGFVSTLLFQIRGKKDAINAGIAGCATGVALSVPGNPAALLQGCATFGVFSYLIEKMNNQAALAAPIAECARNRRKRRNFARQAEDAAMFPSLPPFTLAPAFMEGLFLFNQPKQHLLGFNSS